MNNLQRSVDLLNLSPLFRGFELMLLKNALILCLKDEYTDSIRLLSPKGLHFVSKAKLLEGVPQPRSAIYDEGSLPLQYFKASSTKSLVANTFLNGKTLMHSTSSPVDVYGRVDRYSSPFTFTHFPSNATSLLGILGGLMLIFSLSFPTTSRLLSLRPCGSRIRLW
jgi:hypothetical protein